MTSPRKTERVRVVNKQGDVVEEYDRPVEDDPEPTGLEQRLAALELEVKSLRERVAATSVLTGTDAAKLKDAIVGLIQPNPEGNQGRKK